jgi:hypothetical protein
MDYVRCSIPEKYIPDIGMNTNIYDREKYIHVVSPLRSDDDKDSCLRILTSSDNKTLCQGIYDTKFINAAIDQSDYVIFRHRKGTIGIVVAFALVQIYKNKLDILLVCAITNAERFGNMIAYDIFAFAVKKGCKKIYTEPRTANLRETFMKYGFEHHRGIENVNEVLAKKVVVQTFERVSKTRKTTTRKSKSNNQISLTEYLTTID